MAKVKIKKHNTQGNVCQCAWRLERGVYTLECRQPIKAKVISVDLERGIQSLREQIMDLLGDGHPCLEFEPPLPEQGGASKHANSEFFQIAYNDSIDSTDSPAALFTEGMCKRCGTGLGERNDVARLVNSAPRYDVAGFRKDRNIRIILSEAVLKHITPHVGDALRRIPLLFSNANRTRLQRKHFSEIDFTPQTYAVVPRQSSIIRGWRCPKCNTQIIRPYAPIFSSEACLYILPPASTQRVLLLGDGPQRVIAVDKRLRTELFEDKAIRGLVTERIIFLKIEDVFTEKELNLRKFPPL